MPIAGLQRDMRIRPCVHGPRRMGHARNIIIVLCEDGARWQLCVCVGVACFVANNACMHGRGKASAVRVAVGKIAVKPHRKS